ncbi:MAG: hypothetical protein H5U23_16350 [Phenylobacterium sp.]|nr:hypothetical protein [Phenylobacterium sp.]
MRIIASTPGGSAGSRPRLRWTALDQWVSPVSRFQSQTPTPPASWASFSRASASSRARRISA